MGELIPLVVVLSCILVIVVAIMLKSTIRGKQVVRPINQEELVERYKINIDAIRVQVLARELENAGTKSCDEKRTVIVDYNDTEDRIIRFIIDCPRVKKSLADPVPVYPLPAKQGVLSGTQAVVG